MKATKQYFPVVPFIMLIMVLTFDSVDEILFGVVFFLNVLKSNFLLVPIP